jgi:hypothetical protein
MRSGPRVEVVRNSTHSGDDPVRVRKIRAWTDLVLLRGAQGGVCRPAAVIDMRPGTSANAGPATPATTALFAGFPEQTAAAVSPLGKKATGGPVDDRAPSRCPPTRFSSRRSVLNARLPTSRPDEATWRLNDGLQSRETSGQVSRRGPGRGRRGGQPWRDVIEGNSRPADPCSALFCCWFITGCSGGDGNDPIDPADGSAESGPPLGERTSRSNFRSHIPLDLHPGG